MGWFDQSFLGSAQDARKRRDELLLEQAANDNDSWYGKDDLVDSYTQALRAQQGQALAGGLIAGLTGATTLLSNAYKDAQLRDTSMQEGQIADLYNAGNYNYNNYDQLANDYAQTSFGPSSNYQDIRGMSTGQQVGSVLTSGLTGLTTGAQIGGLPGAILGGIAGLGLGYGGVHTGNAMANAKQMELNVQGQMATDASQRNYAAAHERIGDNSHRQNAVNAVAKGGQIERYASKSLSSGPKQREHGPMKIEKIRGENGLTIRIQK